MKSSYELISLAFTIEITCLALSANFNVLIVSSILSIFGDIVAIRVVFVFPPRESYKSLVNYESLYGTWFYLLLGEKSPFLTCLLSFERAEITFPRVVKDKLIVFISLKCTEFYWKSVSLEWIFLNQLSRKDLIWLFTSCLFYLVGLTLLRIEK